MAIITVVTYIFNIPYHVFFEEKWAGQAIKALVDVLFGHVIGVSLAVKDFTEFANGDFAWY